jgi:hypothetical protein
MRAEGSALSLQREDSRCEGSKPARPRRCRVGSREPGLAAPEVPESTRPTGARARAAAARPRCSECSPASRPRTKAASCCRAGLRPISDICISKPSTPARDLAGPCSTCAASLPEFERGMIRERVNAGPCAGQGEGQEAGSTSDQAGRRTHTRAPGRRHGHSKDWPDGRSRHQRGAADHFGRGSMTGDHNETE